MAWVEVVKTSSMDTIASAARRLRDTLMPDLAPAPVLATVPVCRCNGQCHCGTLVPYLLHRQLELECEFFRDEL